MQTQYNVSLATLSTFGIGGKASELIVVSSPEELVDVVSFTRTNRKPYHVFASASNVVFSDQGLLGLAVQIKGGKYAVNMREMIVDSGVSLSEVVSFTIKNGWEGIESLSGIPGTIGGAVVGNAGAYGHSVSEVVSAVQIWDGLSTRWLERTDCAFEYRESIFKHNPFLVLRVRLVFQKSDAIALKKLSQEIILKREAKYHPGIKCPGSFFKNVLVKDVSSKSLSVIDQDVIIDGKIPAGYLLSEVGAKGMRVGGIEIASYHGNLFVNTGGGTSAQVKELSGILKKRVQDSFGISLDEEIRYF